MTANLMNRLSGLKWWLAVGVTMVILAGLMTLTSLVHSNEAQAASVSNSAPTNISLTSTNIAENAGVNAVVGTLSATDPGDSSTKTYSLVSGTGSTDNSSFNVSGTSLRANASFDFETKSSYAIRLQVRDGGNLTFQKAFTITVTNVNEAPTDILLSASTIAENSSTNTTVGSLSATDPDASSTFTFSLPTGLTDNASFNISSTSLRATSAFNFETKSSYTVTVRVTDQGALTFDDSFTITVTNVNEAPTDIQLIGGEIEEDSGADAQVGTFASTDQDAGDSATYALVSGSGDSDNADFTISGTSLRANSSFVFATKSSYSIRVRVTDSGALNFSKAFTITVTKKNNAPEQAYCSTVLVYENSSIGTYAATVYVSDPDPFDMLSFSLVSGEYDTDNAFFSISNNFDRTASLNTAKTFDLSYKSQYSIRLRVADQGNKFYETSCQIFVAPSNDFAPTDISLSASTIAENAPIGTMVGTLSATDGDGSSDSFTYSLVNGTGSTNNSSFNISQILLRNNTTFNFEVKSSYSIRVQVTDSGGLTFQKSFTITVTNVNEAPTNITLSALTIAENSPADTTVGTLSATDPDAGETATFTLVSGAGSTDNASFNISGTSLRANASFDFETKSSYSVRVRVTDSGSLTFAKSFTITVSDVAENVAPTNISLSNATVAENSVANATIGTLSATDANAGDTATFSLVSGSGDTDNGSFQISGTLLRAKASFDFETKSSYSVRVLVTDSGSLTFEKVFAITVTDVDDAAPTAPSGVTAGGVTTTSLTLSWTASTDNVGVTGYEVYQGTTLLTTTSGATTSFVVTGLSEGTAYTFSVRAIDAAGNKSVAGTLNTRAKDTTPPTVPSNIIVRERLDNAIRVTWTVATDNVAVTGYNVFLNHLYVGSVVGPSYTFRGLTPGTNYIISVSAYDADRNETSRTPWLSTSTVTPLDRTAPTVPTNLQVLYTDRNKIGVRWTASTDASGIAGYNVTLNGVYHSTVTSTSVEFSSLSHSTSYSIQVQAVDTASNSSAFSTALVASTLDGTAPTVPSGLESSGVAQNGFVVTWSAATDNVAVRGYEIYRNGTLVATVSANTTSFKFGGLTADSTHSIQVLAFDALSNKSLLSTALTVTTLTDKDTIAPSAPSSLNATNIFKRNFRINWTAATDNVGIKSYDIFVNGSYRGTVAANVNFFLVTGLTAGTTYSVRVSATDLDNNTTSSAAVSVTTAP